MPAYIVKKEDGLHVYPVEEDRDAAFYAEYATQIIIGGDNILDALAKFHELPVIIEPPV